MVVMEFNIKKNLQMALDILASAKIPFEHELSDEEWRSSCIYFFEEHLRSEAQRNALCRARECEREDRRESKLKMLPNLAIHI